MAEYSSNFKGVWIPVEVLHDKRLTALDKIIFVEICALGQSETGCYASNEHIAEMCGCSKTKVSTTVSTLVDMGYLCFEKYDGRRRNLKIRLSKNESQTFKICKSDFQNLKHSNIDSNIASNIDSNTLSEFERLWNLYPKRIGKQKALEAYKKAVSDGVAIEEIEKGIRAYCSYLEAKNIEKRYIANGGTWFCNKGWNDEYEGGNDERIGADAEGDEHPSWSGAWY